MYVPGGSAWRPRRTRLAPRWTCRRTRLTRRHSGDSSRTSSSTRAGRGIAMTTVFRSRARRSREACSRLVSAPPTRLFAPPPPLADGAVAPSDAPWGAEDWGGAGMLGTCGAGALSAGRAGGGGTRIAGVVTAGTVTTGVVTGGTVTVGSVTVGSVTVGSRGRSAPADAAQPAIRANPIRATWPTLRNGRLTASTDAPERPFLRSAPREAAGGSACAPPPAMPPSMARRSGRSSCSRCCSARTARRTRASGRTGPRRRDR